VKWLVIAALVLGGCSKKKTEPATGSAAPVATGSATGSAEGSAAGSGSAAATAAAGSAVDVPTEQDFEAQAKTDVDEKNVDTKLKALEAQLTQ
jgi:hypothetical protein